MERLYAKLGALLGCFIIPFVCTLLPLKVHSYFAKKGKAGENLLSYMMCFGGGVFFATYILHMAPEARSIVENSLAIPNNITYPIAELIMAIGFFLVLFCEQFILLANKKKMSDSSDSVKFTSVNDKSAGLSDKCTIVNKSNKGDVRSNNKLADVEDLGDPNCILKGSGSCCKDSDEIVVQVNASEETGFFPLGHDHHAHGHEAAVLQDPHSTRSLILLVALSFHRIFEGMSIGLQDSWANVLHLFVAVMCHESAIGFSLGLQFVKNKWSTRRTVWACFLCSLIMPIGVAIGTGMSEAGDTSTTIDIVNGVLQSLATGTFIYVTFFEILQDEISPDNASFSKVVAVLVGFALMAALSAIPEENAEAATKHDIISSTAPTGVDVTLLSVLNSTNFV